MARRSKDERTEVAGRSQPGCVVTAVGLPVRSRVCHRGGQMNFSGATEEPDAYVGGERKMSPFSQHIGKGTGTLAV